MIKLKRAYDQPEASDGTRILVDRLWPRGVTKELACIDRWDKDLAPSNELRKWFAHDPKRWDEFRRRYREELRNHRTDVEALAEEAKHATVTLVYSAKDTEHNQAVALKEILDERRPMVDEPLS